MLRNGLYEQVINNQLREQIAKEKSKIVEQQAIDDEEAPKVIAQYVGKIVAKQLEIVKDRKNKIESQIELANEIIAIATKHDDKNQKDFEIDKEAKQLMAVRDKDAPEFMFSKSIVGLRPETSIAYSSLFTGAEYEPSLYSEFKKEILTCDRIDMLVSFIKWSGLRLILEELKAFTQKGGKLRVLTTSYMGATDIKAIDELNKLLNAEIRVSYDTKRTRLHAKTYVFHRETAFTTAYIGSSNLSNAAMSNGLEWNVKITEQDLPETINKVCATFDTYWHNEDFKLYLDSDKQELEKALKQERGVVPGVVMPYFFDIKPYNYQQEILDKLEAERIVRGFYRNLIVAATGTGKTVIAAFDYKRFCIQHRGEKCRLLFVAHREEILEQSISCFKGVLGDSNFGDLFVGRHRPEKNDHLFVSIQTINAQNFVEKIKKEYYDFIIVDEFHHVAAPTYEAVISHFKPKILLGLTATPERRDGKNITEYFDGRIAAEIRLPEAIERKLLCTFQYFGVSDTVDLSNLTWSKGGYDSNELTKVYTIDKFKAEKRANHIVKSVLNYVTDINDVKGIGFCVSIKHANFMAEWFSKNKIASMCLTAQSNSDERRLAQQKLINGEIKFIFTVDLYNEGVDIPVINTVLFLRPTESLTVFLQQLGRGLRLHDGKECLTVLDFVGQANKRYNYSEKFSALLSNTKRGLLREVNEGFTSAPKGCFIQLERKAKEYVIENIKKSVDNLRGLVGRISSFENEAKIELNLRNFLQYYHLKALDIYSKSSFSRLLVDAGKASFLKEGEDFNEPLEELLTKAFKRIAQINSRKWLKFLLDIFAQEEPEKANLSKRELLMLQMFQFTVWQKSFQECDFNSIFDGILIIKKNAVMCKELLDLLSYNYSNIDFIDEEIDLGFSCPLDLYCNYSRDQILAGMEVLKPNSIREGVKFVKEKKADVFFITLNKTDKDYSPSTMYNDYSINESLFHWQSQSTTSDTSKTGQRYINHRKNGTKILLFVREYKIEEKETAPYTFLGSASYVSHEGSRPMNIVWHLDKPIPARYLKKTNKLANV